MSLNDLAAQFFGSGPPSSQAGQVGDQYHDTTTPGSFYICVTAGSPGTWQQVSGGGSSTTVEATNSTITVTNPSTGVYSVAGGYVAGSNITITGNSIAATGGGGGAPTDATYILQTANGALTNAQAMGALATGLVKNTTTTGVLTTASSSPNGDYISGGDQYFYKDSNVNMFLSLSGAATPPVTGGNNVCIGTVPTNLSSGNGNICFGLNNLDQITTGSFNFVGGYTAGQSLAFSATSNTFIGYGSGLGIYEQNNNTAVGSGSAQGRDGLNNTTFIGFSSTATLPNLTNCGAIGANSTVSVSNAFNLGSGAYIGINNPSPAYSVDIEPIAGVGAIALPVSTLPATNSRKGTIWRDVSNNINYTNSLGVTTVLGAGSIPSFTGLAYNTAGTLSAATYLQTLNSAGLQLDTTTIFSNADIVIADFYNQFLVLGSTVAGKTVTMPDPLSNNPWAKALPYTIMMEPDNSVVAGTPMALLNNGGSPIVNYAGVPITMYPGDVYHVNFFGSPTNGKGFLIGNSRSGGLQGQWFSTTGASIPTATGYFTWQVVGSTVIYTLPGFGGLISSPTNSSFVFKTLGNTDFPSYVFPANAIGQLLVQSNGVLQMGQVTISGGQIVWNADPSGSDFITAFLISPTTVVGTL